MYSDLSFTGTISQWIVWGIPVFLVATFSGVLKMLATLDADPEQEPTKTSKTIGTIMQVIGASLILYHLCAPTFYVKYTPPTLSGVYITTAFSMLLFGYGTYFKDMKESPRSNWIKVSKVFAHIFGFWALDLVISRIYYTLDPYSSWGFDLTLCIFIVVLAGLSALLFWLSYRHLRSKQTL